MKSSSRTITATLLLLSGALGPNTCTAEAPQEHSHEAILRTTNQFLLANNPLNINDAVFGLLGDRAAAGGAGNITNLKCLQQVTADTAFTNARAAQSVAGMAAALMYRAVERNTTPVGGASELCDEVAVNPEIAAITQHQDPASPNAAAINKKIVLDLATQLQAIGADPNLAIQTGTFPAGTIGDPTGDGFICDDPDDTAGCIFSTGMLVADATEAEIAAHLAGSATAAQGVLGATVAAATDATELAQLAALATTVNQTKIAADLQGEANAKGAIFARGAVVAGRHPNAADAQRASAAALSAGQAAAVAAPAVAPAVAGAANATEVAVVNGTAAVAEVGAANGTVAVAEAGAANGTAAGEQAATNAAVGAAAAAAPVAGSLEAQCLSAVRQTNANSGGPGNLLDQNTALQTCLVAQAGVVARRGTRGRRH